MNAASENRVAHLSWDVVAARLAAGAAALLPVGASAKQHGFHLPMNTDQVQAEWLARIVAEQTNTLVWPTLTYGHYPAFVRYAGSASLSEQTFRAVVSELIEALAGFGARSILILDTGISTIEPIARTIASSRHRNIAHHLRIHEGPRYREVAKALCEQAGGSHADELETSRMLALAPDIVAMDRAEASPPGAGGARQPLEPDDASSPNYSRSGSWGDPRLATEEKGEALLRAMTEDVLEMARRAAAP